MQKPIKITSLCLILLLALCLVAACNNNSAPAPAPTPAPAPAPAPAPVENQPAPPAALVPEKDTYISMASGATGGTYHVVVAGMATLIDKYAEKVRASVITGTSGSENFKLVASGDCQIGIGSGDTALAAYAGEREFEEALTNLRFMAKGYSSLMHVVVLDNSKYQKIEDLQGAKIASYAGSSAEFQVPTILAAYGLYPNQNYTPMPMGIGDAADALRDGQVDAIMQFGGLPMSAITNLASTKGVRLLSIDGDKLDQLTAENSWISKEVIPQGTYEGMSGDVTTAGQIILLYSSSDVPDAVVYQAMVALMEHQDELAAIHPSAAEFNLEHGPEGADALLPIHPGAELYYKEKGKL